MTETATPLAEDTTPDWTWLFHYWHRTTRLAAWRCPVCRFGFAYSPTDCQWVVCTICSREGVMEVRHERAGRMAYVDAVEGQDRRWYEWVGRLGIDGATIPLPAVVIADDENRRVAVVDANLGWHPRAPFAERVIVQLEAPAPPFPPNQ